MRDPVSLLKHELLAAAERQQALTVSAAKSGRRRLERPHLPTGRGRRRLVIALATVALAAVVTASGFAVRAFILDRGFIGLPPVGATPSSPESGELVVQWFGFTAPRSPQPNGSADMVRAWLYADGRIIWDRRPHYVGLAGIPEGANEFTSGYLEQRLTVEGVELVRTAVAELIDRSRTLVEEIPTGEDPWWGSHGPRFALMVPNDFGSAWGVVAVPDGDGSARLLWASPQTGWEGTFATPEELSALRRVHALLTDPASVLPPSAWAVRKVRAYVPSHYAVCIDTSPPKDVSQVLSMLPTRAADLLRDKSRTGVEGEVSGRYCFKLATEEAREVADALSGLDPEPEWTQTVLAYRVAGAVNDSNPTRIWFEPYFPHGYFTNSAPFG